MEKFSFFIAICKYEDLKTLFNLLPKTSKMYVKCEMESPGTRKVALCYHSKTKLDTVVKNLPFLLEVCGSKCDGHGRHVLATKYIRWREWMNSYQYEKLSEKLRKRSKFLNRPWLPAKNSPSQVKNFFIERCFNIKNY